MAAPSPYAPPSAPLEPSTDPVLTEGEIRLFISGGDEHRQSDEDYYLARWRPVLRGERRLAGFNGVAFLVPEFWCLYRRMYLLALLIWCVSGLPAGLVAGAAVAAWGNETQRLPILLTTAGVWIGARVCYGIAANYVYLMRARRRVLAVRREWLEPQAHQARVAAAGGTNLGALVAGIVIWLLPFRFI